MAECTILLPDKIADIFDFGEHRRVRCAYGGRGSGKTRSFALMSALRGMWFGTRGIKGTILCARQFQNSLAESSLEEVKRAIEANDFLNNYFEIGSNYIKSKDGNIRYSFIGLARNINSVKSMGRILLAWVDEAEPVTQEAWDKLLPSLREEGEGWQSELWVTWNPARENAPVEKLFRDSAAKVNWSDNPWFPNVLEDERKNCLARAPEHYRHIWEGDFLSIAQGAYFSAQIEQARLDGRISYCTPEPLLPLKAFWDIGGTGAKSDATAIWIAQFVGQEIRVLNYYEAQGQALSEHINWLRSNGYEHAQQVLPHDGRIKDRVYDVSFESSLFDAGFAVDVIANQGAGAAKLRIEAVRRLFPRIWFNEPTTKAGLSALAWYHEKRDEQRNIGLGVNHDWSSHGADAFGLMAIAYEQPKQKMHRNYSNNNSWLSE